MKSPLFSHLVLKAVFFCIANSLVMSEPKQNETQEKKHYIEQIMAVLRQKSTHIRSSVPDVHLATPNHPLLQTRY